MLVAIAVFALGITGVIAMFAVATRSHQRAMVHTEMSMLAQELVSQYTSHYYNCESVISPADLNSNRMHDAGAMQLTDIDDHAVGDEEFVVSANYPRLWYAVRLQEIPDSDAVQMIIKITTHPRRAGSAESAISFQTVLLRRPLPAEFLSP